MMKIDIHQHLWTEPLLQALAERRELPFVRREHGLTVLFLAGERPELWVHLVKHDSTQRLYEELLSDEHLTAWLICWMDGHDTGFHDHDGSAGAVAVVSGAVREERLVIDGPPRKRTCAVGDVFHFSPADIHRVRHVGSDPAVTLHVFSPPLQSMGSYLVDEDGVLARHPVSHTEELRPLRAASDLDS